MNASHKTTGVEIHYLPAGHSCFEWSDGRVEYLLTDEAGHHTVAEPERTMIAEWLDSAGDDDRALLGRVWASMQNGVGARHNVSEQLGVRSMMVGDVIALQTNNHGPKRRYRVAGLGFERIC